MWLWLLATCSWFGKISVAKDGEIMPAPRKDGCPEIESGGFWQLADYPTLVFRIRAFSNLVIVNWNNYHSYKVIMTS